MADLIDRQALKAMFSGARFHYLRNRINKIPSVDAVEVVRCGECEREQTCRLAQRLGIYGYCSEGERREENAAD